MPQLLSELLLDRSISWCPTAADVAFASVTDLGVDVEVPDVVSVMVVDAAAMAGTIDAREQLFLSSW
jgi:hypothetical protein